MIKRSTIKKLLYGALALMVLTGTGIWIFLTFYAQQTLNAVVIPKLQAAAHTATHGRFKLALKHISYIDGSILCTDFELTRIAVDSSEHGIALMSASIDSARFDGVSWWSVLMGKKISMQTLAFHAPNLVMIDVDSARSLFRQTEDTVFADAKLSDNLIVIAADSILLRDISVTLPKPAGRSLAPTYSNIDITLTDVLIDAAHVDSTRRLYSKQITFDLPSGSYPIGDSMYSIDVKGIHGSVADSLITIDSFAYRSNYSEQQFADMHRYIQGQLTFGCAGIGIRGINYAKYLKTRRLEVRRVDAASWYVDYYGDRRKPHDPHPPAAVLPHTIFNSITIPITVDSVILSHGAIRHRERATGSAKPSLITFANVVVTGHPVCTDTANPYFALPLQLSVSALFMGKASVVATVAYPVHQKNFDLSIAATVGPFDFSILNSYLVTNERKEIVGGNCLGGELHMEVRNGHGTTTVTPRYSGLKMRVLPNDIHESRNLFDGLKSFIANTFVLRTDNLPSSSTGVYSGVTHYTRKQPEEFFEYIWLSMKASIAKVVGF